MVSEVLRAVGGSFLGVAWRLLAAALLVAGGALAQDELPCEGVLSAEASRLAEVLTAVPKYQTTYVLVYADRVAEQISSLESLGGVDLRVAVYNGSPANGLAASVDADVRSLPFGETGAGGIVSGLLAAELDAAVVWGPLAGLGILELDFNYELSMLTVGEPLPLPDFARQGVTEAEEADPCAAEVLALLESYGVLPAEKLVPLDIRDLLTAKPPRRSLQVARSGAQLYAEYCAKCHGPEAVAAPGELAPVDLLVSTPRFSFPGFLYIVWNGREQNGMPGFRGALSEDQVTTIYQYARERSHGTLGTTPTQEEAGR